MGLYSFLEVNINVNVWGQQNREEEATHHLSIWGLQFIIIVFGSTCYCVDWKTNFTIDLTGEFVQSYWVTMMMSNCMACNTHCYCDIIYRV